MEARQNSLKPLCDSAPRLRFLRLEEDHFHMEHDREWSLEELSPLLTRWAASLETLYLGSALTIVDFAPRPQAALSFPYLTELILDYKLPHRRLDEMAQHTEVFAALLKTIGPSLAKVRIQGSLGDTEQSPGSPACPRGVLYLSDVMNLLQPWNGTLWYLSFTLMTTARPHPLTQISRLTALDTLRIALPLRAGTTSGYSLPLLLANATYWDALAACLSGQYLKRLTFVGPYRPFGIPLCSNPLRVLFREHVKGILGLEDTCGLFKFSHCGRMHGPNDQSSGLRAGMGMVDSVELENLEMITYESPGEERITNVLNGSGDVMEVTTLLGSKVKVRVTNEM
ncbi:hypothetical protein V8F06_009045 [Rhypophila decipiens]